MKYVIAMIQPEKLEDVQCALKQKGINLMTVSQVMGRGRQQGITRVYRGRKESGDLLKKIKIEIAVNDDYLEAAIESINSAAKTGKIGDGKIFVFELEQCIRISSGETGSVAIG
ncbi:MAG TPA: P-II family nitrogen regulator [bacterium]|nr:P-II family nitrogen regulator [bacterium]